MTTPRNLRSCLVCSVVQTYAVFLKHGCPNCEDFLRMAGVHDNVNECTSEVFEGVITLTDSGSSWVAKWQRLQGYAPGIYAVKVSGILHPEYIDRAEAAGVRYIPRDGSATTDEQ